MDEEKPIIIEHKNNDLERRIYFKEEEYDNINNQNEELKYTDDENDSFPLIRHNNRN